MPSVSRSALVAYSADTMFDLVNDVDAYAEFLPGCAQSKVLERGDEGMKAALLISKAGVNQWFTTLNEFKRGVYIKMKLVDGPFTHLSGGWTFSRLSDEACKIELNLEFEFSSKLAEMAFGKVFNTLASNMVQAFTLRAKEVHQ